MKFTRQTIIFIVFAFLVLMLSLFLTFQFEKRAKPQYDSTPTQPDMKYNQAQQKLLPTTQPEIDREEKVGSLLTFVPYSGKNFTLHYDVDTGKFKVILYKSTQEDGMKEFKQWLRDKGILDISWIRNLEVFTLSPGA